MSFLRNRLLRRFSFIGRIADLALVGGVAARFAFRKGWLSDEQAVRMGLAGVRDRQSIGAAELFLALAAAMRLVRRRSGRGRRR